MGNKKKKRSWGWSHTLTVIMLTVTVLTLLFSFALMWKTNDASALAYIVPSVIGALAACLSFYFWKAKAENVEKFKRERIADGIDISDLPNPEDIQMDEFTNGCG